MPRRNAQMPDGRDVARRVCRVSGEGQTSTCADPSAAVDTNRRRHRRTGWLARRHLPAAVPDGSISVRSWYTSRHARRDRPRPRSRQRADPRLRARQPPRRRGSRRRSPTIEREVVEIPCVVGGAARARPASIREVVMPHRHRHVVARFHAADAETSPSARSAPRSRRAASGARCAWEARAAVLLRAAELLAGPWRMRMNAATMHGQSEDLPPGRDRRRVRADRLLAVQRRVRAAALPRCSRRARPACGT